MVIRISNVLFSLTFPGTILYYVAISQHIFPPMNLGFFGLMCTLSLLTILPLYIITTFSAGKIQPIDLAFFLFLGAFALIAVWHGAHTSDKSLMIWHLVSIAQSVAVFILCKKIFSNKENHSWIITASWVAASACILIFSKDGRLALREISNDVGTIPSYQTFAFCYMVTTIFVASKVNSRALRQTVHIAALTCLYVNSARSEFAGYLFFAALLEFLSYKSKSTPIILTLIMMSFAILAVTTEAVKLPESRITALADLQNDNSNNERDRISREGIEKIFENPIFGAYGQYEEGEYIHNIMSVWQETGLFGALFFIFLIITPALTGIANVFSEKSDHLSIVGLSLILTTILLLIAGKYFTYLLVPTALALCSVSKPKPTQQV
ncbi:O-antigen ligase domain-containing protein [Pseudomonas shirazica]|nr:O-antigen ligase domain-containing protein [Pseudomonas shirazica]